MWQTASQRQREDETARLLAIAWRCQIDSFPPFSPVDRYAHRGGRIMGLVEIKNRTCRSDTYPDVFLAVRKWLALQLAGQLGHGVPGMFVAGFADAIMAVNVAELPVCGLTLGGRTDEPDGLEPMILCPIAAMRTVKII